MFRDKKLTIAIIAVLMISVIGLGIAFAAFSQTLTINGTGTVESSSWSVVFEGADGSNTIGAPTLTGTATEVTHPTIKNNSTEISNYAVTLKTPGDYVIYNFKIHNKGDYAANLTSLTVAGVDRPRYGYANWKDLVKDYSSVSSGNREALGRVFYYFKYTSDDMPVGYHAPKDCLEPGESVDVYLKIIFSPSESSELPSTDLVLDNLEISAIYTQTDNGSCSPEPGRSVADGEFVSMDDGYYTYEGKTFKGTGVGNIIISENVIGLASFASEYGCSNGSTPTTNKWGTPICPTGASIVLVGSPAADMAASYCTGCRLMTSEEAVSWRGGVWTNPRLIGYYNGTAKEWWVDNDLQSGISEGFVSQYGSLTGQWAGVTASNIGVRPAVSIPSTATMTGSGTQQDPYVITP